MKKVIFLILILALASCRPSRELNNTTDFSNVLENLYKQNEGLKELLRQSEKRQMSSSENSEIRYVENTNQRENENVIIREFDTKQPDNPIIRETIIERITESETNITSSEIRDIVTELFESILAEKEAEFERNTLNVVAENNQLREEIREKETKSRANFWYALAVGFISALILVAIGKKVAFF